MTLAVLTAMTFLVTLGLLMGGMYFFVEVPAAKRRMRARLTALQEISALPSIDPEAEVMRQEVYSHLQLVNRILLQIPPLIKLNLFLKQAATEMTVGMLLMVSFLTAWIVYLVSLLARFPLLMALPLAVLAGAVPFMVLAIKRQRRFSRFEELFPDAIDLLARAVRAGHAFTTGLELIARELPEPVAREFGRTYEQQNLGLPLREALRNFLLRVPLPDVNVFVTALVIQRESGGNLAEILDNLSYMIRERFKLMRQIKVFTAQGRMTLYVLISLPPLSGLMLYFLNPNYMSILFTDPLGTRALSIACTLQFVGYFVIRKIIRPRV